MFRRYLATALLFAATPALKAGTLGVNIVAMFPRDIAEFAYADLKDARKFPWYAQFKSQALPARFSDLEHFLASARVDENLQIDELAWSLGSADASSAPNGSAAPDPENVLAVALGNFDPEAAKSDMKKHKIIGFDYRGFTLYPCAFCGDLSVVFIDSSTIAFGHPQLLEQLIDVRAGAGDSLIQNDKIFPAISQINGRGIFWGVLNRGGTRQALRQMVPEVTQFPQATRLLAKLKGLEIRIQGSNDLEAHFQFLSSSADDSATIAQLLQAGVLMRQFEAKSSEPELAALLGSVRIVPNGEGVEVSLSMTSDQVISLIKQNTFSAQR